MIGTLQQALEDMEHGVYDFTKDGNCSGCGQCCSSVLPLSSSEIKEIKRYIKKHHIKEQKHFAPTANPTLDMTCPFLDDSKENDKCTIYSVRPKICRCFICNQPPSKVKENKELFWRTRKPCDMRETFFWGGIMTREDKIKKIARHYGYEAQSRQCTEEMAELTQAINKFWRKQLNCGKKPLNDVPFGTQEEINIEEELVDVYIMILQLKRLHNIPEKRFQNMLNAKLDRQFRRMEEENVD